MSYSRFRESLKAFSLDSETKAQYDLCLNASTRNIFTLRTYLNVFWSADGHAILVRRMLYSEMFYLEQLCTVVDVYADPLRCQIFAVVLILFSAAKQLKKFNCNHCAITIFHHTSSHYSVKLFLCGKCVEKCQKLQKAIVYCKLN